MEQSRKVSSEEQLTLMSGLKDPMMRAASSCVAWLNRFGIDVTLYLISLQSSAVSGSHFPFEAVEATDKDNRTTAIAALARKLERFKDILIEEFTKSSLLFLTC